MVFFSLRRSIIVFSSISHKCVYMYWKEKNNQGQDILAFFFLIDTHRSFFILSIFLEIASEKLNRDVFFA